MATSICLEASRVHEMTAREGSDSCTGGEEKITTDGAVSLEAFLSTLVLLQLHAQATIACHAMEEVDSQSPPQPAQVAKWTVVYRPLIIKKFAYSAEVLRHRELITGRCFAGRPYRLNSQALHAHHLSSCFPIHGMVADFIMTETTSEELVTTSGQELAVSLVVLTPKHLLLSIPK
jgi:hypothetical protein